MRHALLFAFLALAASTVFAQTASAPDMAFPKVETKTEHQTQTYTTITHSCPAGYEAHYVDVNKGFDYDYYVQNPGLQGWSEFSENVPMFTICFSKEFMDKVRKNKDLLSTRPAPPKGV